jgi:hypothetical protein
VFVFVFPCRLAPLTTDWLPHRLQEEVRSDCAKYHYYFEPAAEAHARAPSNLPRPSAAAAFKAPTPPPARPYVPTAGSIALAQSLARAAGEGELVYVFDGEDDSQEEWRAARPKHLFKHPAA